jgi:O-acetylhomoserine (thiol)-lyase
MAHSAPKTPHPETLAVHAGQSPDPATGSRAVPIYQTASYVFPDTDTAAALFNMETPGHVYSRLSNPTVAVFEERMAHLEGGAGSVATASGQAALHLALVTLMGQGGHVVASASLYGGSHNLLAYTLPRFGIEATFVPARDLDAWRAAIRPETRLLFGESVGNPSVDVLDIPALAEIASEHRLPLLVDATVTTPLLGRPFDQGAHLVMHSATKFLSGHGVVIGGVLVDGGRFDWAASGQISDAERAVRGLPRDGVHRGVDDLGLPVAGAARGVARFRRVHGADDGVPDPAGHRDATAAMARHIETTDQVVDFLASHATVVAVHHPRHLSHPDHALAQRLYPRGCSAILSFELKGGREAGRKFIEALTLFSHLANIGDAKSLVIHPASTTHFRMDDAALHAAGITPGTVRLSIGLEHASDILDDLGRALYVSQK